MKRKNKRVKNYNKRHFNRIFILLILLMLTAITLSFSSFAWFSTNRLVRIDLLDVNIKSDGGIEISSDANNWSPAITVMDIINARTTYPNSVNQIPKYLEPVSSAKEIDNGKLKMFLGTLESDEFGRYYLGAKRSIEVESFDEDSNGQFVAFDLFVRSKEPNDLYLTPDSNVLYGGEISSGIENAVRIAFVDEGTVLYDANPLLAQSLLTNNNNDIYFWEPNYDTHSEFGIKHAREVYGINTTNGGNPINYYGISNVISKSERVLAGNANSINYPNLFKKVNIDYYTVNKFNTNKQIFSLQPGITKIRVYLWIEGQDVDCENNANIGNILLNLQFTTDPS